MTTAAQNMRDLCRKLLLLGNHFFGWLKAEDSSTACGTSTLKSPPLRAFSVPDVHPRPRKRPPRCTLDCGFKTSESPALRGFVAERAPIRGTSLYLVLKSNGLHRPKIRLKKFGFSPKTIPANIAKKLPSQLPTQSVFQLLSQTAHVCFHRRKRVHTRLSEKDRTQALTRRNRGHFGWGRCHYPRHVLHVHEQPRAGCQNGVLCRFGILAGRCSRRTQRASGQRCAYACRCPEGVAAPLGCVIFFVSVEIYGFTPRTQGFLCVRGGGGITCSSRY